MSTLIAIATLPAGLHPAGFRTPGIWNIALAALASTDGDGALRLDRGALAARSYTGLLARASVAGEPQGSILIPAGGRATGPIRLSDAASVLPVVTWNVIPAASDLNPSLTWLLPGRAAQTWPANALVALYLARGG